MINFIVDRVIDNTPYPTLQAYPKTSTESWVNIYPYTQTLDLIEYCREFDYPHSVYTVDQYREHINTIRTVEHNSQPELTNSYYIIHIGFFDFTVDYINLLPLTVKRLVKQNKLRILFYYHEGDDPKRIKQRLDSLCDLHCIDYNSYRFITGNTNCRELTNFIHFADHELLFYLRNKNDKKILKNTGSPMRVFSSLVRTHKWWRATALADLLKRGLLDNSYWSYNTLVTVDDSIDDCPIKVGPLAIRNDLIEFMRDGPYSADDLTTDQHNDHSITYMPYYENAYCNIIFETLFDAGGSYGAFLTEKTFKPIKHGQPFVVVGCAGSLELLRKMGYRVFDSVIDNSYDLITDNTERWLAIRRVIESIKNSNLELFRRQCRADVLHNQQLFLASKRDRLNMLFRKLTNND